MNLLKNRLFRLAITVLSLIFVIALARSIYESRARRGIIDERKAILRQTEERATRLKNDLREVESQEFVEKEAREKLGFIKEGETVVFLTTPPPEKSQLEILNKESISTWKKWLNLFF